MRKYTTGQQLKQVLLKEKLRQVDILKKAEQHSLNNQYFLKKSHLSNYVNDYFTPD